MKIPRATARDYLRLLFRRKYVLLIPIVLGALLIVPLWTIIPPKYRAMALVRRKDLTLTSAAPGSLVARDAAPLPINALRVEILTWTNLKRVIHEARLDLDLKSAEDWEQEYEALQKAITIHAAAEGRGVDMIEIYAVDSNPAIAQNIANAVAENYVEESLQGARQDTESAIAFFKDKADDNLRGLQAVELEMERFSQENGARLALQNQLLQRKKDLAAMMTVYQPEHPQVKAAQKEVSALEAQFNKTADLGKRYAGLERMRRQYEENYEQYHKSQLASEARLQAESGIYGTQVQMISRAQLPVGPWRMERLQIALICLGIAAAAGIALTFLLEAMDHSLRGAEDSVSSLGIPVLATLVKISPREERAPRPRGWSVAAGHDRPDAPENRLAPGRTGEPLPFRRISSRWKTPAGSVLLYHDRIGQFAAQMRGLRANLLAPQRGAAPRVITVTSGSREEGKTTVAANLAVALSEVESRRVLLVDGDILRPSLHRAINVRVETGLREVIQDSLKLDGHVYETAIPNLDILPAPGIGAEAGLEAPIHQRFGPLVDALRKCYAYVIIDTPPVLAGSHAASFAKHSDGVILVARLEKTPRQVIRRTADELTAAGGKVIGCVLTHHVHHVPNLIYRFLGSIPSRYYRYGDEKPAAGTNERPEPANRNKSHSERGGAQ